MIKTLLFIIFSLEFWTKNECFYYFQDSFVYFKLLNLKKMEEQAIDYKFKEVEKEIEGTLHINLCNKLELPKACSEKFENLAIYFLSKDEKSCRKFLSKDREQVEKKLLPNKKST